MAGTQATEPKAVAREMWSLGDYHRLAKATVWELGPVLVEAWGIGPGQRVLDVAAGTGNVAIRAAEAGADVVASDLTPEHFDAGRREARTASVALEWVEADAEALPFGDGSFDVVTSSFDAMFAPNHRAVADELVRVCRPGGTIGIVNFAPGGTAGAFFDLFARHAPPPPEGALPPILWGSENHVRELFGDLVESLELTHREYVERAASPEAYVALFEQARSSRSGARSPASRIVWPRSTGTSATSPPAGTKARREARGVPLRVPARGRPHVPLTSGPGPLRFATRAQQCRIGATCLGSRAGSVRACSTSTAC
jgi:ubiquinone/menaquinone biosynthesis C-methylase UbiE